MNKTDNTAVYNWYSRAFRGVAAWVIAEKHTGKHIANVSMKYPQDGSGRLYVYLHIIGLDMVRGSAAGGGYDKGSAAMEKATEAVKAPAFKLLKNERYCTIDRHRRTIADTMAKNGGWAWQDRLAAAGYAVFQAV